MANYAQIRATFEQFISFFQTLRTDNSSLQAHNVDLANQVATLAAEKVVLSDKLATALANDAADQETIATQVAATQAAQLQATTIQQQAAAAQEKYDAYISNDQQAQEALQKELEETLAGLNPNPATTTPDEAASTTPAATTTA